MSILEGRFSESCEEQFPEVSNYNFRENLFTRGSNERSFRWEDVNIKANYLYREATSGGSFEINNYTGLHSVTNFTGVNYITTSGTMFDGTSFPGWTITGGYSLWIDTSGSWYAANTLSGLATGFRANPIEGNCSIGLYTWSGYNSRPSVISRSMITGDTSIVATGVHQVYTLVRSAYSPNAGGETLHNYVRGWSAGTIVAYLDPFSGIWNTTPPSSGFLISSSGYTEIKYLFTASDYPAANPTGFDLFITPIKTGGFIVIDDLHVDARLRRNAFVDYVVPSGYLIEVTPDLGWKDKASMFTVDGKSNNPFLKTLGPYSTFAGNLEDNLDNTLTATIDSDDFDAVLNNRYNKYLWRAIAVRGDGELGLGGLPQRFEYVGDTVEKQFSVTSVSDNPDNPVKTIIGTKSQRSTILVDTLSGHPGLLYPTATTWKLGITINEPTRTLALQAQDSGGSLSSIKYITLENKVFDINTQALWNVFDEHGMLLDLVRLPDESNNSYQDRLKNVMRDRGGSTFVGIVNGGSRDLGLKKIPSSLTISIHSDNNIPAASSATLEVRSTEIIVNTESMIKEEILIVDPIFKTIKLSKQMFDYPTVCELDNGKTIDQKDIIQHSDNTEFPGETKIIINDPDALGKPIRIRYAYYEDIRFKDCPSLGAVVDALNQITDVGNVRLLDAELSDLLSGNEDSLGLILQTFTITPTLPANLSWSPFILKRVSDRHYREYLKNYDTYKDSKFYEYVKKLQFNSRTLWGHVEADRDYWDAASREDLSFDTIPTITDPPLGEFYSNYTGASTKIESTEAWGRGYKGYSSETLVNIGIDNSYFQPGVGGIGDLSPDIYLIKSTVENTEEQFINISQTRRDNNLTIFTG